MSKIISSAAYGTLFFSILVTTCQSSSSIQCKWGWSEDDPHVYWVNMDKSATRKASMSTLLDEVSGSSHHHRVRGITLQEIYIPSDVETKWNSYNAVYETEMHPTKEALTNSSYKVVVSSLFGRKKNNRLKELGCTISHLMAMREAIYDTRSKSKYAIITEDDVQFPFAVNWDALIASAPKDFGILMLFNSNKDTFHQQWNHYHSAVNKNGNPGKANLWVEKWPGQPSAYWSTCAYLINKQVIKPSLDGILTTRNNGIDDVKIIAGVVSPCIPKHSPCCLNNTGDGKRTVYSKQSPCIWSPKGYQADAYLYAMAKTYVLTVPIIVNGAGGNESTFHQVGICCVI
jgi:GR25 family glycosyltransferase involved in LPS biosynthesis